MNLNKVELNLRDCRGNVSRFSCLELQGGNRGTDLTILRHGKESVDYLIVLFKGSSGQCCLRAPLQASQHHHVMNIKCYDIMLCTTYSSVLKVNPFNQRVKLP